MIQKPPVELLPGKITDHTQRASISFSVTGHMKAYILEALHKEAYTTSVGEYVRDIVARHVAETLDISPLQILSNAPSVQATAERNRQRRYHAG